MLLSILDVEKLRRRFSGQRAVLAQRSEMAVTDQLARRFVPQPEGERLQAADERNRFHALKQRLGLVAPLEVVIGNARAQVMDVMKSDVARKPLQDPRQFVKRTAFECRRRVIPLLAA